jgi:hypothetical protein
VLAGAKVLHGRSGVEVESSDQKQQQRN